jgi:Phosphopantetheine attachment site
MDSKDLLLSLDHLLRLPAGTLAGPEALADIKSWDSLAAIEYIALVDEMFGVDVPPYQARECKRVQDLVDLSCTGPRT